MARLDTGWHANPKILRLSAVGMALHAWSISYCDFARSDGFIPEDAWPMKLRVGVKELERAGLWESCEGGQRLHDYLRYNRSRAQIEARLAEDRERKRPDSGRNHSGNGADSAGIPRAPGPGPVKYVAAAAVNSGQSLAREAATAATIDENLPDEVRRRLAQPPIDSHAHG